MTSDKCISCGKERKLLCINMKAGVKITKPKLLCTSCVNKYIGNDMLLRLKIFSKEKIVGCKVLDIAPNNKCGLCFLILKGDSGNGEKKIALEIKTKEGRCILKDTYCKNCIEKFVHLKSMGMDVIKGNKNNTPLQQCFNEWLVVIYGNSIKEEIYYATISN